MEFNDAWSDMILNQWVHTDGLFSMWDFAPMLCMGGEL